MLSFFSVFLFNLKGEVLILKRLNYRNNTISLWSNLTYNNFNKDESNELFAKNICKIELGLTISYLKKISSFYLNGQIYPIFIGKFNEEELDANKKEIEELKVIDWKEFIIEVRNQKQNYENFCIDTALIINDNIQLHKFLSMIESY